MGSVGHPPNRSPSIPRESEERDASLREMSASLFSNSSATRAFMYNMQGDQGKCVAAVAFANSDFMSHAGGNSSMYIYNQYYVEAFIGCGVTEAVSYG